MKEFIIKLDEINIYMNNPSYSHKVYKILGIFKVKRSFTDYRFNGSQMTLNEPTKCKQLRIYYQSN